MNRIRVLDSTIYNKIAAGEVVERPSSVVKELVENSIDAASTDIVIEISGGGLKSIRVTDNGSGIEAEDIKLAFLPHTTSKLLNEEDLFSVATLGFRGEALSSIASVSMVNVKSKTQEASMGHMLGIKGGQVTDDCPCSMSNGTIIEISNLFYNTPARLKFMKKPKTEEGYIGNAVSKLILANPDISIKLIADDILQLNSSGKGFLVAIESIYDFSDKLIPINYSKHNITIAGYIGIPTFNKSNRTYQNIIINGRSVNDYIISSAVSRAYNMTTRSYPVFILDIKIPFCMVDVNVHPAKAEVRFSDNNLIFSTVYSAVDSVLKSVEEIAATNIEYYYEPVLKPSEDKSIIDNILNNNTQVSESTGINAQIIENILNSRKQEAIKEPIEVETKIIKDSIEYKIVGQLFNTFIVVEYANDALIIDQHAAMERLNYDALMEGIEEGNLKQPLLIPYILKTNYTESGFIDANISAFSSIGVEIEQFGNNTYRINTVPSIISGLDLDKFFSELLSVLNSLNSVKMKDAIMSKIAQAACKASLKGGTSLSEQEIRLLINRLTDNKTPLLCPHGRPAIMRLKRAELDKWFKRTL